MNRRMFLPLASLFVVGLASFTASQVTGENRATVPHQNCLSSLNGTTLNCNGGNYSIPGNFDVSLVPQSVTIIHLGSLLTVTTLGAAYMSTIHDNAPSLNGPVLAQLALYGFQGTNGKPLPIEGFLVNVKATLTRLQLRSCRIGTLGPNFLQGFNKLRHLRLGSNDISAIDINAFETRASPTGVALSVVNTIDLKENQISTLDWAAFATVAHSLQHLYLSEQEGTTKLSTLTLSKPFTFAILEDLELQENSLSVPSRAILDTLNINGESFLRFEMNDFCPDEQKNTCPCCEAKDFITWAHELGDKPAAQRPSHLSFSCGDNAFLSHFEIVGSQVTLPPKNQHAGCVTGGTSTTKRTTGTTATKTTARTTKVVDVRSSTSARPRTSTSATPGTRPNQLVGSSPAGPSASAGVNRSATALCGITLAVMLYLQNIL